ncbi:MAG: hypothetical protein IPL51_06830 [Candidatus Competibacteraceae bacterium]|nr:hypothetical protein [Candidatus Competibacteraceae bacterium]
MEQQSAEAQRWLDEIYPVILTRARTEKALIYWGDETAVVEDGYWLRGYTPRGKTPVLAIPQWPVWTSAGVGHQQLGARAIPVH